MATGKGPVIVISPEKHRLKSEKGDVRYEGIPKGSDSADTPFSYAASNDHDNTKPLESLLAEGLYINEQDSLKRTSLHYAVMNRRRKIVEFLLQQAGINVNMRDVDRRRPLHYAVLSKSEFGTREYKDDLSVVEALLRHAPEVNCKDRSGTTPLMEAAEGSRLDIVRMLLKHGAQLLLHNNKSETCLHTAARSTCNEAILAELIKHVPRTKLNCLQQENKDNMRPLDLISMRPSCDQLAKTFIKTATLVNMVETGERLRFRVPSTFKRWNFSTRYAPAAHVEVARIGSIPCGNSYSLRDFALYGVKFPDDGIYRAGTEDGILGNVWRMLVDEDFPIYNDIIVAHFRKAYCIGKLSTIGFCTSTDSEAPEYFPDHLIDELCLYLTKKDLLFLVKALAQTKSTSTGSER